MPVVQTPKQFLTDFIALSEKAKKRIYLQSMLFEAGRVLEKLSPVLMKKAQQGVDVRVTIDWVSKRYVKDNANLMPKLHRSERERIREIHEKTERLIDTWSKAGISFTITNKPNVVSNILSIYRRNHIKMYLIDNTAAWIGGANLLDDAMKYIDIMVKFKEPAVFDGLVGQYFKVNHNRPQQNYSVQINSDTTLLIDAGIMGRSLIYNTAAKLIKQAQKSVIYASQFVPDGKVLKEMLAASERGVHITIVTNNENHKLFTNFPYNIPYKNLRMEIKNKNNISILYQPTKVHAKLLIVDNKTAIFGSHNLVSIGVLLATEEIAICTKDKDLVAQILTFIKSNTIRINKSGKATKR